jgi:hypothetical protein
VVRIKGMDSMEPIEFFTQMRDACDEAVKALEGNDANMLDTATDKFMLLMNKLDCPNPHPPVE